MTGMHTISVVHHLFPAGGGWQVILEEGRRRRSIDCLTVYDCLHLTSEDE
jgi:hypothetical protein